MHVPSVVPFVQPGPPRLPFAFGQPPEYQAQSMPFTVKRSPIVGFVRGTVSSGIASMGEHGQLGKGWRGSNGAGAG
jgi:hypothetical protein